MDADDSKFLSLGPPGPGRYVKVALMFIAFALLGLLLLLFFIREQGIAMMVPLEVPSYARNPRISDLIGTTLTEAQGDRSESFRSTWRVSLKDISRCHAHTFNQVSESRMFAFGFSPDSTPCLMTFDVSTGKLQGESKFALQKGGRAGSISAMDLLEEIDDKYMYLQHDGIIEVVDQATGKVTRAFGLAEP
jgi:hypothetical protein